jgi:hypothetical protein
MIISELFEITPAKSRSTDDYAEGETPFVTNASLNNGVVAYVDPFDNDRVFEGPAICISGLGHATVHLGSFLPKGNGGDACAVLVPKEELSNGDLLYYAALFNTLHGWRFSFGRKTTRNRLERLDLSPLHGESPFDVLQENTENNIVMAQLLVRQNEQFSQTEDEAGA